MNILDTLYYSIYRFGRSIRQPHFQAKACAGGFMPAFFYLIAFFLYCIVMHRIDPNLTPGENFKPIFQVLLVLTLISSYAFYIKGGRGQKIISKFEKCKNQKFYIWLGAIFSIVTVSTPVWMWFVLRAVMK